MTKKRSKIIPFLNNYWIGKNLYFGDLIFSLSPTSKEEWAKYLISKNYFINFTGLASNNFNQGDYQIWKNYLKNSFWNLYVSETAAINFFKKLGIKLTRISHEIDIRYGIDYYFEFKGELFYLIVKNVIRAKKFLAYKDIKDFLKISNSKVLVFDSSVSKLFKYKVATNSLVSVCISSPNKEIFSIL